MSDATYNPAEYRVRLESVWMFAKLIEEWPLAAMIAQAERANEIGPYLDPTAWMKNRKALEQDLAMLRALHGVQVELAKMNGGPGAPRLLAPSNPGPSSRPQEEGSGAAS